MTTPPLGPLPVQARPRTGETAHSYIRRLARANHLRPSYLNALVRPWHRGTISPEKLAALSGRPVHGLRNALTGLDTSPGSGPPQPTGAQQSGPHPKWPGPVLAPVRAIIDNWLTAEPGLTALAVWERLLDEHEAEIGYATVARYLARTRQKKRSGQIQ